MRKFWILVVCCLVSNGFKGGPDYRAELLKILSKYNDPHYLIRSHLYLQFYDHYNSNKVIDTLKSNIQLQGSNFHYTLRDHEYLKNDKFFITVNHTERLIFINAVAIPFPVFRFDSLLSSDEITVTSLGIRSGVIGYKINVEKGPVVSAELWFNQSSTVLTNVVLFYNQTNFSDEFQAPRIEVEYKNTTLQSRNSISNIFSEKKFFTSTGNTYKMTDAFKNYKLVKSGY